MHFISIIIDGFKCPLEKLAVPMSCEQAVVRSINCRDINGLNNPESFHIRI